MSRESIETWGEVLNPGLVIRYTRLWLHYGSIAFVVFCTVVGAVRGLAGS